MSVSVCISTHNPNIKTLLSFICTDYVLHRSWKLFLDVQKSLECYRGAKVWLEAIGYSQASFLIELLAETHSPFNHSSELLSCRVSRWYDTRSIVEIMNYYWLDLLDLLVLPHSCSASMGCIPPPQSDKKKRWTFGMRQGGTLDQIKF